MTVPDPDASPLGSVPRVASASPTPVADDLASVIDATTPAALRARGSLKWTVPPAGHIGAFVAEMDFGAAPAVAEALRRAVDDAAFGYLPPWLEADYAQACVDWQLARHGWRVDPANVHAVGDVLKVLQIAIDHFTRPGSPVILPTPAYTPFFAMPLACGREIIEVPCLVENGYYRLDLDGIAAAFRAGGQLLVLCNPHNPVGRMLDREELLAVSQVVHEHGGRVFADEIHAPLSYPDSAPHVPYASLSEVTAGHTITGTSASKAFNLPGLKCAAAIVSNERDAATWAGLHMVVTHGAATIGAVANIAAYTAGGPWLAQVLDYLAGNRALLADLVAERLPGVRFRPPEGTYLAWLDFRDLALPTSPGEFLSGHAGVMVNDGLRFGAPGAGFARLNMATPRPILEQIVDRIAGAVSDVGARSDQRGTVGGSG